MRAAGEGDARMGDDGVSPGERNDSDLRGCTERVETRFVGEGWFALLIRVVLGVVNVWGVPVGLAGLVGRGEVPAEDALLLLELARRRPDALGERLWPKAGRTPGGGRRYISH